MNYIAFFAGGPLDGTSRQVETDAPTFQCKTLVYPQLGGPHAEEGDFVKFDQHEYKVGDIRNVMAEVTQIVYMYVGKNAA